jgi:spermidine/putrescine transport system ATP-binding protein
MTADVSPMPGMARGIAAVDMAAAGQAVAPDSAAEAPAPDTAAVPADIAFRDVSKHFGEVVAVDRLSFAIAPGSFHSFLGPSGCGKTTSLRLMAGFDQPTQGEVFIGGAGVNGVPPHRRPVNMVFQNYALFPHLDVRRNVGYGLRQRKPRPGKAEIDRQVDEALELVRLTGLAERRAWELSGGQQQRVALARALINRPTVLLLDEPLAALDRKLRREMQIELQSLQREVGITFVLVTHDQEEALSMSDTIAIMRDGHIVQQGSPAALYDAPVNRYVADFVGQSNFFAGEVVEAGPGEAAVRTETGVVIAAPYPEGAASLEGERHGVLAVRPEVILIAKADEGAAAAGLDYSARGRVSNRIFLGEQTEYSVATDTLGRILVRAAKTYEAETGGFDVGDEVVVGWRKTAGLALHDD